MVHSWEIIKERKNRVLVGMLCPGDVAQASIDFMRMFRHIQLPPGSDFAPVVGLPFDAGRNQVLKMAYQNGMHCAYLDLDLRVPPDTYIRLLESQLPYVGGLYYQKFPPYNPCIFNATQDAQGNIMQVPVLGWKPGDIVPVDFLPTGILLIRNELLGPIFQRWPLPFTFGVDIAPVPDFGGNPVPAMSEDFGLCWRVQTGLGIKPACMTGIVGLHEVRNAVVGPKYMIQQPDPHPLRGVVGVVQ